MSDYNNKPRFPRKSFGNKSFGDRGGFNKGPREMFKADCASCGNSCEVPFRPNGSRPVFCNNCFSKNGGGNDRPQRREFSPRPSFQSHSQSAPQAPRDDQAFKDLKAELRVVNQNLERLISIMTPSASTSKAVESKPAKTSKKKAK
jgi:CxxC-x17-CxxC domain-containing protein